MDKGKETMGKEETVGGHYVAESSFQMSKKEGLQGLRVPLFSQHNGMYGKPTKAIWHVYSDTPKESSRKKASTSSTQGSDLLTSLIETFELLLTNVSSVSLNSSIYRVPERVRGVRGEAYTPMIVSIGPFHHGKEKNQVMDDYKLSKLDDLVKQNPKILVDLLNVMMDSEVEARNSYAETIPLKSKELIKILLVDGVFIVTLFCEYEKKRDPYHQIFSNHWISNVVYRDLLLLENQLPFSLLEKIFKVFNDQSNTRTDHSFLQLTRNFLASYATIRDYFPIAPKKGDHLVDLMLNNICSPFNVTQLRQLGTEPVFIPSATELHDKGIRLRKGSIKTCILQVDFTDGVLSIPHLHVDGRTESLFRNLLAMEQSHCGKPRASKHNVFSDYLTLLDCLINTPADVALLRDGHILHNELGDNKELAQLFNNLRSGVDRSSNEFFYNELFVKVNRHMKNRWPTWSAIFQKDYLSTPWKIASITAALILVICTVIQTTCSVKQTKWQ